LRLVIDREGKLSDDMHILDGSSETIVFTNVPSSNKSGLKYILLDKEKNILQSVLDFLHTINVHSVMVEGGKILIDEFLRQGTWDEARVFTGDKTFGRGVKAPEIRSESLEVNDFAGNMLRIYKNKESW
jgi:diaminohydroxyphosphoribosylaminopyrimidine deaminase/5-amino-6-(5-phosphoribosylamino)uracil reductase